MMTDDDFRKNMCGHMAAQTNFLKEISEGMHAVRMFGRVVKWIIAAIGSIITVISGWSFLTKH